MFVKYGKRRMLICQTFLILAGIGVQMIKDFAALAVGRSLIGLVFGMSNAIAPLFIKDIVFK